MILELLASSQSRKVQFDSFVSSRARAAGRRRNRVPPGQSGFLRSSASDKPGGATTGNSLGMMIARAFPFPSSHALRRLVMPSSKAAESSASSLFVDGARGSVSPGLSFCCRSKICTKRLQGEGVNTGERAVRRMRVRPRHNLWN